jgi:hypothetical protein
MELLIYLATIFVLPFLQALRLVLSILFIVPTVLLVPSAWAKRSRSPSVLSTHFGFIARLS